MLISVLLLVLGLGLLIKGADWLVEGAASLARKFNISELVIGLTIVAFGTSAPELIVNSFAAFEGQDDIVLGNIIGSNNFNLLVILGISGLIAPLVVQSGTVWKEIPFSLLAALVLFILGNDYLLSDGTPALSRVDGLILLAGFSLFLFYIYKNLKKEVGTLSEENRLSNLKITLFIIVGLAALVFGGRLVVNNAIVIAQALEISEKVIGLTIVAAGTSLPELATSLVAAAKKNNDIAVGNVIGSNIFNIFFILSISALIRPVDYNTAFNTDLYILMMGTALLFVAMFTGKRKKLDRWEAVVLLIAYVVYTVYLISGT